MIKKPSFLLYKDFNSVVSEMTDEQAGTLFKAIHHYQSTGEVLEVLPELTFLLKQLVSQFKRDDLKYKETCVKRSIAGKRGAKQKLAIAGKRKHKVANQADIDIDIDIEKGIDKETPPLSPKGECDLLISALEDPRRGIIKSWVDHKRELRKPYKQIGLKALITKLSKFDDDTVRQAIEDSMSNGWAGLFPEKVATKSGQSHIHDFE